MAYQMKLNTPYKGMPHIWNLSATIGPLATAINNPDDIELFQILLTEKRKVKPPKRPMTQSIPNITVNRTMDAVTGLNVIYSGLTDGTLEDALVVSPAKSGQSSYGKSIWTIVHLNHLLFQANLQVWGKLHDPTLLVGSHSLKTALHRHHP